MRVGGRGRRPPPTAEAELAPPLSLYESAPRSAGSEDEDVGGEGREAGQTEREDTNRTRTQTHVGPLPSERVRAERVLHLPRACAEAAAGGLPPSLSLSLEAGTQP